MFNFNYCRSFFLSISEKSVPFIILKINIWIKKKLIIIIILTIGRIMQSKVNFKLRSAESNPSNNTGNYKVL